MQDSRKKYIILKSNIFEDKPKSKNSCDVCGSTTKRCGTVAQASLCNNYKPKKTNNDNQDKKVTS
jgi:hypothetical protein